MKLKAALDVHYNGDRAKTVCLLFRDWKDMQPVAIHESLARVEAAYEPGRFYKRELPCLLEVLKKTDLTSLDLLMVDGYVYLDDEGSFGLGGYLFDALNSSIPVVGVAKRKFRNNQKRVAEIKRGNSHQPLYITAIGMPLNEAAEGICRMAGNYRIPTLLKVLDQRTKAWQR